MPLTGQASFHWRAVLILAGVLISKAHCCPSNTVQHKRNGDDVILHFQARTKNASYYVLNFILFPNGSQLLNARYIADNLISRSYCIGCSFIGNAARGNLSIRIENLQASGVGTYKHAVNTNDTVLECVTVYMLGVPTKPIISVDKDPSVGESVTLTCRSTSTTTPSNHGFGLIYTWRVDNEVNPSGSKFTYSTDRKTLTLSDIVKEDANKDITCTTTENVNDGLTSTSSISVSLDVLFPPDDPPTIQGYDSGDTYRIIENSLAQLSCSVKGGNPLPTLSWKCYNEGTPAETVGTTVIKNVTWTALRNQDRQCTCHTSHVIGDTQNVSVNIQILHQEFYTDGNRDREVVTVDEHDEIQFICVIDSNLTSLKLIFENNILKEASQSNSLSFKRKSATSLHGGVYTCEWSKGYGNQSNKTIRLLVKCSPRPIHQLTENMTSALHLPVTLRITVLAYPEPGPTGYLWHKEVGLRCTPLLSNADLQISSSGLQSNLTILNVSQSDYGQYRVTIVNSVGTYEQFFFLTENKEHTAMMAVEQTTMLEVEHTTKAAVQDKGHISSSVIVGVTLGVLSFAVIIYATVVTVLWKRKSENKETKSLDSSTSQPQVYTLCVCGKF